MEASKDNGEEEEGVQEKERVDGGEEELRSQLPELVCVEYPGIVANPGKMIDTLGGLETLAQVLFKSLIFYVGVIDVIFPRSWKSQTGD